MIEDLEIQDLRVFKSVQVAWDARANVVVGPNASGKTSLLETLVLLSTGRSFRNRKAQAVVRFGCDSGYARGSIVNAQGKSERAVQCRAGCRELRENGAGLGSAAAAQGLPVVVLTADAPSRLLQGQGQRRALLRWLTFHVEPSFLPTWSAYKRVLAQRNAALQAQDRSVSAWNTPLCAAAVPVSALLRQTATRWNDRLLEPVALLGLPEVQLTYDPIVADLPNALERAAVADRIRKTTTVGPHRDGVTITCGGAPLSTDLSGGQMKRVALALLAAQLAVLTEAGASPLALVDDATAALDRDGVAQLMRLVRETAGQWFITTPELPDPAPTARLFHVEQGRIRAL